MLTVFAGGLLLGIAAGFHCAGMCGPIVFSLSVQQANRLSKKTGLVLYNLGRVITYTLLGLLFGMAGRHFYLAGLQQWLSVATGIIIVILALQYFLRKHIGQPIWVQKVYGKLLPAMLHFLQSSSYTKFIALGMLNGLLPCGMVYLGLAAALSHGSVMGSAAFMFAYGLGTLPVMLLVSFGSNNLSAQLKARFNRLIPYVTLTMGLLLVLRGMNLGIPFISPVIGNAAGEVVPCH